MAQHLLLCCPPLCTPRPTCLLPSPLPHSPAPQHFTAWGNQELSAARARRRGSCLGPTGVRARLMEEEPRPGCPSPRGSHLAPSGSGASVLWPLQGSSPGPGGGRGLVSSPQSTLISTRSGRTGTGAHPGCQWVRMGSRMLARRGPGIRSPQPTTSPWSSLRSEARGSTPAPHGFP